MQVFDKKPIGIVKLTVISIMLACTYFFGALMYTPSLPAITAYFHVGSTLSRLTISSFLLVMALSQLFYGPASDKYGRKPIILFGAFVFLLGSLISSIAPSIYILIIARGVQGLGAGSLIILARTIIQDSVSKKNFLTIIAWMGIFFAMAPAISPLIGGILESSFGWHSNFIFMSVFSILLIIIIRLQLPETIDDKNHHALNLKFLIKNYSQIITNKLFIVYIICVVVALSGSMLFDAIGSFIVIDNYGYSALLFGLFSTSLLGLTILSRIIFSLYLIKIFKSDTIIVFGLTLMLISALSLLLFSLTIHVQFIMFMMLMASFYLGCGFVLPTSGASALSLFNTNKGAANAMYGALQMGGIFALSFIAALLSPTLVHMAIILTILSFICLIAGIFYLI